MALPMFGTTATHAAARHATAPADQARAFFQQVKYRGARILDGNSTVRDEVAAGQVWFGLTDTDDALDALRRGARWRRAVALGVGGVWLWVECRRVVPEAGVPDRPPVVPADAGTMPNGTGAESNTEGVSRIPTGVPPVEVACRHFMSEMHGHLGDPLTVGSPNSTPTRIQVSVMAEGQPSTAVVLEKYDTGKQAAVISGPKHAGGVRSYLLKLTAGGWSIVRFEDLEG